MCLMVAALGSRILFHLVTSLMRNVLHHREISGSHNSDYEDDTQPSGIQLLHHLSDDGGSMHL
jgi:hypothetical protein